MKIFIIGGRIDREARPDAQVEALDRVFTRFAECAQTAGHDILVCSPFRDSADYFAVVGATKAQLSSTALAPLIEFHYPDSPGVDSAVRGLVSELQLGATRVKFFSHPSPSNADTPEARSNAWLLAQISALDRANVVVALGGREDGSASLLLRIAETRRKPILPLRFLNGASGRSYDRLYYELSDKLGDRFPYLNDPGRVDELVDLATSLATSSSNPQGRRKPLEFFISYARARPEEGDYVETLLRRRNFAVYRDEEDFTPGAATYDDIRQHIFKATVFVAIWCKEYACSPWCFDELEVALDRHRDGKQELWLINVDGTRVVPPRARGMTWLNGRNRAEVEASILHCLNQIDGIEPKT